MKKGSKSPVVENFPPREDAGKARDKAGAALNVSGKAVGMAAKVRAKAVPKIVEAVETGAVSVSAAAAVALRRKVRSIKNITLFFSPSHIRLFVLFVSPLNYPVVLTFNTKYQIPA